MDESLARWRKRHPDSTKGKEGIKDLSESNASYSGRDTLATGIFQCLLLRVPDSPLPFR